LKTHQKTNQRGSEGRRAGSIAKRKRQENRETNQIEVIGRRRSNMLLAAIAGRGWKNEATPLTPNL